MIESSFAWATVTQVTPLRVQLDGDAAALLITPKTLIDPAALAVSDRVRVELSDNRLIVVGRYGGSPFATNAETLAGILAGRAITPAGLKYAALDRITALEARKLAGFVQLKPTSLTLGSGSGATISNEGTVSCPTGVSSLIIEGLFNQGYDNVALKIDPAGAGTNTYLYAKLTNAGTPSSVAAYVYGLSYQQVGTIGVLSQAAGQPNFVVGYNSSDGQNSYDLDMRNLASASMTPTVKLASSYAATTVWGSARWNGAGPYTGLQLFMGSGNLFACKIRAYGYAN